MRRGLAGLLVLPDHQPSASEHSGQGSSPLPAAGGLMQQAANQPPGPGGLCRHGSGTHLPPPPAFDTILVRSLSGVPCPPSPIKLPAADGLARQLSGLPLAAALSEAAWQQKPRKRARSTHPNQAASAAGDAAADEGMDEAEQKRQARLMRNRQTAAASRQRRLDHIAFLEARVAQLEGVLGQFGIEVPEPQDRPKTAAPNVVAATASTEAALVAAAPLHHVAPLPASFNLAMAAVLGPLAHQPSLPQTFSAGLAQPSFQLSGNGAAAAAATPAALSTPPSQVQQPPPVMPGAPTVPSVRQAPPLVPQAAPLDLPSGVLPCLTPAVVGALQLTPAAPAILPAMVAGGPTVLQPQLLPGAVQSAVAASRAAAAAATVAAMSPQQKAAFLARLQQLHPDVLPQLETQRGMQLQLQLQPPPQLPTSEWAASKLEQLVVDATCLLNELTRSSVGEGETLRPPAMPLTALTHAQALAFVFRRKTGALLSVMNERAFLVARQGSEGGNMHWSAPVFCRGFFISAGLTAGWMDLRMCLAIRSEHGLQKVLRPYCSLCGLNAQFLFDMNGPRVRQLHTSSGSSSIVAQVDLRNMAKYFTLDAGMLDFSVRVGRFTLDRPLNDALYGRDAPAEDILAGRLPPPVEFGPFYSLLDNYARSAFRTPSMARLALGPGSGRPPHLPSQLGVGSGRGLAPRNGTRQGGGLGAGGGSPPGQGSSLGRASPPNSLPSAGTEASSGPDLRAIEEEVAAEPSAESQHALDFSLA